MKRLIAHVAQMTSEEAHTLTIQDVGICITWYEAISSDKAMSLKFASIPRMAAQWIQAAEGPAGRSEGRRNQWVLRDLIEELKLGKLEQLTWDELSFLLKIHGACHQATKRSSLGRLHSLLEPFAVEMRARLVIPERIEGLPGLRGRLHVVALEDFLVAPVRSFKILGGIVSPCSGPFITSKSHVRVLGNVPPNAILVVEDGSCCVDGFMMGTIVVRQHCDVAENISGTVIAARGDIRARNIIDRARTIAKWGSVFCRQAQDPELVYAGTEIYVAGTAIKGRFLSPRAIFKDEARGSEIHVSRLTEAGLFRGMDTSTMRIILRKDMSCVDYGESPGREGEILLRRAGGLRWRIGILKQTIANTEQEMEDMAGGVVYYICTAGQSHSHVESIQIAQKKLATYARLTAAFRELAMSLEERAGWVNSGVDSAAMEAVMGDAETLLHFDDELTQVTNERDTPSGGDMSSAVEEARRIHGHMRDSARDEGQLTDLLIQVRGYLAVYDREIEVIKSGISRERAFLNDAVDIEALLGEKPPPRNSKYMSTLLRRILTRIQEKTASEDLIKKASAGFVRAMLGKFQTAMLALRHQREEMEKAQSKLRTTAAELQSRFSIRIHELDDGQESTPIAKGRFGEGVRIYADIYTMAMPNPPDGAVVKAPESTGITAYRRSLSGVISTDHTAGGS